MKLFKKAKKGFTLIELVVVIAVIAILSTIAIISFISVTNKAKLSNDQMLVDQVNLALTAEETLNGKRNTVHETLVALQEDGFSPENFKAESKGYQFVYTKDANRLALFKDGKLTYPKNASKSSNVDVWLFTDKGGDLKDGYSHYLRGKDINVGVAVNAGLDVGFNANIPSVVYTNNNMQNVVIRTNSANTSLTIDDSSTGTINHYGSAGALNIIQCHTSSYHENGNVAFAEIAKGRIVLEGGSEIKHIHVNKKTNEEAFDTVIIADNGAKVLPEAITRDEVTVETETLVVKVESNGTTENVYVYADGTTGNKGSTEKITTGENKQNENVNSDLGKLVLDNGSASDKALGDSAKENTRDELVETAVTQEEIRNSNHEHTFVYTSNNNGTHTGICECGETVTEDCDYTAWSHDAEGHWHSCIKCEHADSVEKESHTWSLGNDDTNATNKCTQCGRFRWTAAIGNVGYPTLKDAINADNAASLESGYKGSIITMLNDEYISVGQYVTINEKQIISLDLNGCTLLQEIGHSDSQTHIISSNGTLTINDSSVSKTGMIYSHHKNTSAQWSAGHYAVDCAKGSITINGGTLKQVNDVTDISWALHCGSYGNDATTTINGGTFIGDYYDVGLYNNSGGSQKAYINGGTFKGTGTNIYMQFATSNSNPGMLLEINGGEFITSKRNIVYVSGQPGTVGVNASDLKLSVTGGSFFVGDNYKNNGLVIGFASYSVSGEDDSYVSGGTFNFNPESECMNGYYVKNENGSYKVKSVTEAKNEDFIVQVGNSLHCMFKSAVKAADGDSTIRILKDCEISSSIDKNVVIDLNGRTISGSFSISASDVTIKNGTVSGAGTAITIYSTSQTKAKVTLDNVNIVSTESDAIVMKGNAIINFNNNCSVIASGSGCDAIYVTSEENEIIGSGNVTLSGVNADLHLHAYDNYRNNGSGVYVVTNYNGTLNIDITGTMTFVNNKLSVTESSKYYDYFDVGGSWNGYAHQLPSSKVTAELSISSTGTFNIDVAEYVINN